MVGFICVLLVDCFVTLDFVFSIPSSYFFFSEIPFNRSSVYVLKFLSSIFFLIFIRAGLPRYRYDYLTLLGWTRLLIVASALVTLNYVCFFIYF